VRAGTGQPLHNRHDEIFDVIFVERLGICVYDRDFQYVTESVCRVYITYICLYRYAEALNFCVPVPVYVIVVYFILENHFRVWPVFAQCSTLLQPVTRQYTHWRPCHPVVRPLLNMSLIIYLVSCSQQLGTKCCRQLQTITLK